MAENIVGTVPGMLRSRGHDILGGFASAVVAENGYPVTKLSLKPNGSGGDMLCRLSWNMIERGKATLAGTERQASLITPLMSLTGNLLSKGSTLLRQNVIFNNILLQHYREAVTDQDPELLLSSHYLAFDVNGLNSRGKLVGPDFFVQPAAKRSLAKMPVTILSPLQNYSDTINRLSPDLRVLTTGTIVPQDCYDSINPRLGAQEVINSGKANHRAFISIGGSGPERPEAQTAIAWLLDNEIPTTVICGTEREDCVAFRAALEKQFGERADLYLIGGESGYNREQELYDYRCELANPANTICLSRPNETLMLSASLGYKVLMFRPYQVHEQLAFNWLTENKYLQTYGEARTNGIENFDEGKFLSADHFIKACEPSSALSYLLD